MIAGHDERPRGNEGASSAQVMRTASHGTSHLGRTHVTAPSVWVEGRHRGRYVGTYLCPNGHRHVLELRKPADVVTRQTPCGLRVVVHVAIEVLGAVA